MLTPTQIESLLTSIERAHIVFIGSQLGTDTLTPRDVRILRSHGIDVSKLPLTGKTDLAFRFGLLAEALGKEQAGKMSFDELKQFVEGGKMIPLSLEQQLALRNVKTRAYSDIRGLENRIKRDVTNVVIQSGRERRIKTEKKIREAATKAIIDRQTVNQFASELGHKTQDWARDFDRIADYVLHESFDLGKAHAIIQRDGDDAEVYKEVYDGACDHCQGLYLTAGIGSKPIIFKLSDLMANGSNVGRKTKEWKPVVGPTHPWCRCELEDVPKGYEWSDELKRFRPVRIKKVERKSRAKVTITMS